MRMEMRRVGLRCQLKDDPDAVDDQFLAGMGDVLGRGDGTGSGKRYGLAEPAVDVGTRPGGEERTELVSGSMMIQPSVPAMNVRLEMSYPRATAGNLKILKHYQGVTRLLKKILLKIWRNLPCVSSIPMF